MPLIKVLWFTSTEVTQREFAGTGNWVITILDCFRRIEGYQLHVAFHDSRIPYMTESTLDGVRLYHIPPRSRRSRIRKVLDRLTGRDVDGYYAEEYYRVIDLVKPDIIQIFGLESNFIRILERCNDRVVVHIQGLLSSLQYKYYPRFSKWELIRSSPFSNLIMNGIPRIPPRSVKKHLKLESCIYDRVKYYMGRTDWDRRCVKALSPQAKYFYCQELMRETFTSAKWKPHKKGIVRLYTTTSDGATKNVDMIYEVAAILDKHNPNFKYQWRVAGVCENSITPKIMKFRGQVSPNIHLLGRLTADKIVQEMMDADLFVYPSAMENGCNAVQEAMLVGVPIVATHAGGLSTTIKDYEYGILVQEGDPYVLVGAIVESFENYDRMVGMAFSARTAAKSRHDRSRVLSQLVEAYETIVMDSNENTNS